MERETNFTGLAGGESLAAPCHLVPEGIEGGRVQFRHRESTVPGKSAAFNVFRHHHVVTAKGSQFQQLLFQIHFDGGAGGVDGDLLFLMYEPKPVFQKFQGERNGFIEIKALVKTFPSYGEGRGWCPPIQGICRSGWP